MANAPPRPRPTGLPPVHGRFQRAPDQVPSPGTAGSDWAGAAEELSNDAPPHATASSSAAPPSIPTPLPPTASSTSASEVHSGPSPSALAASAASEHGPLVLLPVDPSSLQKNSSVILPHWAWPKEVCSEHHGLGWDATISWLGVSKPQARIRFCNPGPDGTPYDPVLVPLSLLRRLGPEPPSPQLL